MNPAIDRTIWVDRIREDEPNRIVREENYAGGKSVDVSKVLKNLGVESTALGFVGGFAGRELEGRLLNEGVGTDFVRVAGETRTNIIIHEMSTGRQIAFYARGPEIKPHELMMLIEQIESLRDPEIVTIGGSLPPGLSPAIYRKVVAEAKKCEYNGCKAKVFLDVDGRSLGSGIEAMPDVIKPNVHELGELMGRELKDIDDILAAARDINRKGVKIVLVSMGPRGILLVSGDEEYLATPPEVKVENTVGAGDSSVAGFIYGMINGKGLEECLIYAVAAGTATTLRKGTALASKEDFERLIPQISLRNLKENRGF